MIASPRNLAVITAAILQFHGTSCAAEKYVFTTLPPNGANYSSPKAINQNDVVVGFAGPFGSSVAFVWQSAVATFVGALPTFYGINSSGFALSSDPTLRKAYSLYDIGTGDIQYSAVKGGATPEPLYINSSGLIGAEMRKGGYTFAGIINGSTETVLVEADGYQSYITGLNDAGTVIAKTYSNDGHGFVYQNGKFTDFVAPGSSETIPSFIAANGTIVGSFLSGSNYQGFLLTGTVFTLINVPKAVTTYPVAIGPRGEIVGYYEDQYTGVHGFTYRNGKYVTIDYPAAISTYIAGVNSRGSIIGTYEDAQGYHGFIGQCATAKACKD